MWTEDKTKATDFYVDEAESMVKESSWLLKKNSLEIIVLCALHKQCIDTTFFE